MVTLESGIRTSLIMRKKKITFHQIILERFSSHLNPQFSLQFGCEHWTYRLRTLKNSDKIRIGTALATNEKKNWIIMSKSKRTHIRTAESTTRTLHCYSKCQNTKSLVTHVDCAYVIMWLDQLHASRLLEWFQFTVTSAYENRDSMIVELSYDSDTIRSIS